PSPPRLRTRKGGAPWPRSHRHGWAVWHRLRRRIARPDFLRGGGVRANARSTRARRRRRRYELPPTRAPPRRTTGAHGPAPGVSRAPRGSALRSRRRLGDGEGPLRRRWRRTGRPAPTGPRDPSSTARRSLFGSWLAFHLQCRCTVWEIVSSETPT